jgi:signal transduction histidine kinase
MRSLSGARACRLALALTAIVLGVIAYRVQIHDLQSPHNWAKASVVAAWTFVFAGLVAWLYRPGNRLGPLMVVTGFALIVRQFRYTNDPLGFTTFFAVSELSYALVAHTALAYPAGRVSDRLERAFLAVAYPVALLFPIATLLTYGRGPLHFFDPRPRKSLIYIAGNPTLVEWLQKAFVITAWGVLAAVFVALIARRLIRSTPRARHILAPLLFAAVVAGLRAVFECVRTFVSPPASFILDNLFWWQIVALSALPLAILAGLLLTLAARATVGDLLVELENTAPRGLRDALAHTLGDPTLEVAFWLPERKEFVDGDGRPTELPRDETDRAVTLIEHDGEPLAALVHDPIFSYEPKLIESVGAAARLALENARLQAELRAQLAKVQESRARLVAAADEERRRIERNIHDGAQQRLVALALELRIAQRQLGDTADPVVEQLLSAAAVDLQEAVDELRELARGIHPAILTDEGIGAALGSLACRCQLPVTIEVSCDERLAAEIEGTADFVACEALANAVKHAQASSVTIRVTREDNRLVIAVEDDGVGGADPASGSGLRGLADRVEAHGGTLMIESPLGRGTQVIGEIPCES